MIYLQLFVEYFKIGLFAIGGGLATIPFLQQLAGKYGWFTTQELVNMIAISESTPGPIGVNMATYVGFQTAGIPGAIIASIGLEAPSVIIIVIMPITFAVCRTTIVKQDFMAEACSNRAYCSSRL